MSEHDYLNKLSSAGFENASIEVTRVYGVDDAQEFLAGQSAEMQELARQVDGKFVSGFIRAVKPALGRKANEAASAARKEANNATCCAPSCCSRP